MDSETPMKIIIAHNLAELRKAKGLTQIQLANKFGYSDKSVSKWEHGETTPDIETLSRLCDYYGVTLDYLIHEGKPEDKKDFLSDVKAPIISTTVYIALAAMFKANYWVAFIWWVPVDFLILFILNCVWGPKRIRPVFGIGLTWTVITSVYLEAGYRFQEAGWGLWMLFLIGIPLTVASILWNHVRD